MVFAKNPECCCSYSLNEGLFSTLSVAFFFEDMAGKNMPGWTTVSAREAMAIMLDSC